MKILRSYTFEVEDGKVEFLHGDVEAAVNKLKDGKYVMVIKEIQHSRSLQQNRLYWIWLTIIADETGHEPKEMHEYFRAEFLTCLDKKFPYVRSTTDLSVGEFTAYLNKIEFFATTELNIILPDSL